MKTPARGSSSRPRRGTVEHEHDRPLGNLRKRIGELGCDIVHSRLEQDQPRTLEEIVKRVRPGASARNSVQ